jgi:squalene-hopene/tetraprenyl-beta-curcumene cyclase
MTATEPDGAATQAAAAAARAAAERGSQILLARQDKQGFWSGGSAGDVTLEAEALLLTEVLGIRTAETTSAVAQQIRSLQQADGRWTGNGESAAETDSPAAAGDLSASVLAYLALRLAGDSADAYHLALAAGWIRDAGGVAEVGVLARTWLALFGLTEWSDVPVPVPELSYLPGRYAASRPAAAALAIIGTLRPVRPLPISLGELRPARSDASTAAYRAARRWRPAPAAAHAAALRRCGQWLISWQHRAGLPAAGRPSWPCSLVALHLLGYPLDHPVLAQGLSWLAAATSQPRQPAGTARPAVVRQQPVLETTLAVEALADAGIATDHASLVAAANWLLLQRIEGPAHGPSASAGPEPSGWSFSRDGYPVAADTARVLLALSRVRLPGLTGRPAIRTAVRWLTGMQSRDGSWDGVATATAQVVRALAAHGESQPRAIRRGVVWLLRQQRADGSWSGPDGRADLIATMEALPALIAAGVLPAKAPITSAACWLAGQQNSDGGWASSAGRAGPGVSDARATGRAVAALMVAGGGPGLDAIDFGVAWLVRAQQADGAAGDRPPGRSPPRRRAALMPVLLQSLGALGRYTATTSANAATVDAVPTAGVLLMELRRSAVPAAD